MPASCMAGGFSRLEVLWVASETLAAALEPLTHSSLEAG